MPRCTASHFDFYQNFGNFAAFFSPIYNATKMGESQQLREFKSRHYIQDLIEEGEHEHQDFKFQISDARKIARSISAFANNSGGHLLVGVKDNGRIAGVRSDEEIYMIEQAAQMYCRPPQKVQCTVYRVEGKSVLKVDIAPADTLPVMAQDDDCRWRAYYRVADENVVASALHVKIWKHRNAASPTVFTMTDSERTLIAHIENEGDVTLHDYSRLAHITRATAEQSVINLCAAGILTLRYHAGECYITSAPSEPSHSSL